MVETHLARKTVLYSSDGDGSCLDFWYSEKKFNQCGKLVKTIPRYFYTLKYGYADYLQGSRNL